MRLMLKMKKDVDCLVLTIIIQIQADVNKQHARKADIGAIEKIYS